MESEKTGFRGFQPLTDFKMTRRNLPHWQDPGKVYFLTWRCAEEQELAPEERDIAMEALRYWDALRWTVYAAVVMPNHVHTLAQPLLDKERKAFNLAQIIHSVKSFSAHRINRERHMRGSLWQDERYDRIIRDEAEFLEKWEYIRTNPVKRGLCERPEDYPWLYQKQD